jgi:hypothetical protein
VAVVVVQPLTQTLMAAAVAALAGLELQQHFLFQHHLL